MPVIEATFASLLLFSILAMVGIFFLIGCYGILSVLKMPVNWATWIIGTAIIAGSVAFSLAVLMPNHFVAAHQFSSLLGGLSFLVAVYSTGQWAIRRWYVHIKKHTSSLIVKGSKNFLLFLRKHHPFFGWIVTLAAVAHVIYYLPILPHISQYAVMSGFAALGVLLPSVLLGEWIWFQCHLKKRKVSKIMRMLHSLLAIAFFAVLIGGHFGAWLLDKTAHH